MNVFLEKQFIKRWWLFMLILAIIVIGVGTAYYATVNSEENIALVVSVISLAITIPIVIALLSLRLETRIDEKGIFTYFHPLGFTKKFYSWSEIKDIYVRTYDPLSEYGGWGIRGLGRDKRAYIIEGNTGIQIITKDDKKFLVGTLKGEEAKNVIRQYHTSVTNEV
ncbi:hypothetical protein GCM10007103_21460 [Salinimicrobium marinum]|uniref:Uncharacterized protein n=1 Tax=Salinimicrobium marinum TaxID=680283 RepID=A0A918SFQ1_9FLAO|nr:hypothetical protein [Salinimicrobium marinum]GHA39776.1 hypothetical protein GCM10007103_21460 [Salinimicrobium marinum]